MQLIGLLDSPFVRRVAISMLTLRVPFDHHAISVFRGFEAFHAINPVVKAPTLVGDDGTVLMDSSLILQYVEATTTAPSLLPPDPAALLKDLRIIGLALAACEKTAQMVYERGLRPAEKYHQPWIDRVSGQLLAAFAQLERETAARAFDARSCRSLGQAGITTAVAWHFSLQLLPEVVPASAHPALVSLSSQAEKLPEFIAAPHGEGTVSKVSEIVSTAI